MCQNKSVKTYTDDELVCLVKEAKDNGDVMEELITMFMPLIKKGAKTYFGESCEDAISEGIEAFIKCVYRYTSSICVPFPYYCKMAVYSHVRNYSLKERTGNLNTISLDSPVKGCEDILLEDTIPDNVCIEEEFITRISHLELLNILETLDYIEKETILRHYILEHPLKRIAEDMDYSYRGIKYAKTRGLEKLRKSLKK